MKSNLLFPAALIPYCGETDDSDFRDNTLEITPKFPIAEEITDHRLQGIDFQMLLQLHSNAYMYLRGRALLVRHLPYIGT